MKYTHITICLVTIAALSFFTLNQSTQANANGAPAGHTNSPGDGTNCTFCHGGSASNLNGVITSDIPAGGYVNGATYNFSATISGATVHGFQISPQSSSGALVGTLINGTSGSKLISSNKYITHTSPAVGAKTWTFQWTAPSTGTANVVFYGAFVLGNGNNNSTGDQVRVSTYTATADLTVGVDEANDQNIAVSLYPNPADDMLQIRSDVEFEKGAIYSLEGKLIKHVSAGELNVKQVDVSGLDRGLYFIRFAGGHSNYSFKFIVR